MLKPQPNGRARRARASPYEREHAPSTVDAGPVIMTAMRAQQRAPITPVELERALTSLNQFFEGRYVLEADWSASRISGGVLMCTRRNGLRVRGRHGRLRVRLEFEDWRRDAPELVPYGTEFNKSDVLGEERQRPYHRIQLESDPGVKPWKRRDVRTIMPALCSALGLDPAGTKGIQKVWTDGLPETRASLPSFDCWSRAPRPEIVKVCSPKSKFNFASDSEDDDGVEELAFGRPVAPKSKSGSEAPLSNRFRNPLDDYADDELSTKALFKMPSVVRQNRAPEKQRRKRPYQTPNRL